MKNEVRYQQIAALLAKSLRRDAVRPNRDETREVAETELGESTRAREPETVETTGGER
ncbi:hypothetical protein [Roseiconus nitratireducens]|uniref:hypothetical protein n=1 Tax=Roseiconus nitratireducens TaxID=2605748 RepID=UPI001375C1A4|nr:hypothetical protein [Roseiconus nitratireducens]